VHSRNKGKDATIVVKQKEHNHDELEKSRCNIEEEHSQESCCTAGTSVNRSQHS